MEYADEARDWLGECSGVVIDCDVVREPPGALASVTPPSVAESESTDVPS